MGEFTSANAATGGVLAAVDMGPDSKRVLLHAAALARLFSTSLTVLHVGSDASAEQRAHVWEWFARQGPYEVDLAEEDIVVRTGMVSDAIYREAVKQRARLVVMGSRGHSKLASFFLGSTTQAVLRNAPAPILLVPPVDLDIVSLADRARLSCGPVLAAVDLAECSDRQLQFAGELAQLAGQPLVLLTVTGRQHTDRISCDMLRDRAYRAAVLPSATIVRHGHVADQISQCAAKEHTGLVVMGLTKRSRRQPGAIATAVLRSNAAFVLAVPEAVS